MSSKLDEFVPIFYPQTHAVIGASSSTQKFGGRVFQSLLTFGPRGRLCPVNPQESEVQGTKAYASVKDIPGEVDFATIVVPAPAVPAVLRECLGKGVKGAQVLSAGFREVSEEGARLEAEVVELAGRGIRIIGPNCFGVYSPDGGVTMLPGANLPRRGGRVGFISQSGGYGFRVPNRGQGLGITYSKVVSYGNACDINECDLVEYLAEDPETDIITGYIEGVNDGPRFFRLLREVCRKKPVILWKGGLTSGGARAVRSHTASLGGDEQIWEALFRQTGVIRVEGLDELLDTTLAFLHLRPEPGRRVAPIGGGGGIGVAATDSCERMGLSVPAFPEALQKKLEAIIPGAGASARNPVDVAAPGPPPRMLRAVMETVAAEAEIDIIIVDELDMVSLRERAEVPVEIRDRFGKPVVIVLPVENTGSAALEAEGARRRVAEYFAEQGLPVYLTLERAAGALVRFTEYHRRFSTGR
ncbi:MAG: acetate--CoA ligase family protein [Dehalococcoidia bacterium]